MHVYLREFMGETTKTHHERVVSHAKAGHNGLFKTSVHYNEFLKST